MRALARCSLLIVLCLLTAAVRGGEPAPAAPDLTGPWSGHWHSGGNDHRGPLHARFRKVNDSQYRVTFRGRFWKVVPFVYSVKLDVVGHQGDKVLLAGSQRLGPLLGSFHYSVEASATDFVATFHSRNDHGTFVLQRRCR